MKKMLSKKDFMKYIKFLQDAEEFENKLNDLCKTYRHIIGDAEAPCFQTTTVIVELLEKLLELTVDERGYSTLSWWISECDFGENFKIGSFKNVSVPKNHKYHTPDIKSVDNLYDYLIWEAEYDKSKKEAVK